MELRVHNESQRRKSHSPGQQALEQKESKGQNLYRNIELWLVRHGLTKWNVERRYQGHTDLRLLDCDSDGLNNVRKVLRNVHFTEVYCSDLVRCRQTLERTREDLVRQATFDARLREMNFGDWEGHDYNMLRDDERYRSWIDAPMLHSPPGGESWDEFTGRIRAFCQAWAARVCEASLGYTSSFASSGLNSDLNSSYKVLIVTHGGVISAINMLIHPELGFWDTSIGIGEVWQVELNEAQVLAMAGEIGGSF